MKLADVTEYCRKLRTRKTPMNLRPKLTYLVEARGMYSHPDLPGFTGGQTAWADPRLWFSNYGDAKDHADALLPRLNAKVMKLNLCAFEEAIKRS